MGMSWPISKYCLRICLQLLRFPLLQPASELRIEPGIFITRSECSNHSSKTVGVFLSRQKPLGGFTQSIQANAEIVRQVLPQFPLPSIIIILPFDAVLDMHLARNLQINTRRQITNQLFKWRQFIDSSFIIEQMQLSQYSDQTRSSATMVRFPTGAVK